MIRLLLHLVFGAFFVGMARLTPEEAAAKWANKLAGATEDYRRGVERVQQAPGILAARQADKYRQRVMAAVPKWQARVASVDLGTWQRATVEKGTQRIAAGAQASQPKMAQFMSEVLPHIDRGKAALQSMPSTTLEDNIARAQAWIRHMASFRRG